MRRVLSQGRSALMVSVVLLFCLGGVVESFAQPAATPEPSAAEQSAAENGAGDKLEERRFEFERRLENRKLQLENKRLEYEKRKVEVEEQRLSDARSAARWTAASIIIPIILGFATILWQAKTAYKIKQLESDVAFQLKAAEVVMQSKSTRAAEERAIALRKLFPKYISAGFVSTFESKNFKLPGLSYQEKKLELFKLLAGNLAHKKDVFQIYAMLYADEGATVKEFAEKWKKAFPEDAAWLDELQ